MRNNKKMKELYFVLINKKIEYIKFIFVLILSLLYYPIYHLLADVLKDFYTGRIIYIALMCVLAALVSVKFSSFLQRNWESLILMGMTMHRCFLLFLFTNYDALFLQIFLGTMICQMQGINLAISVMINIINAVFVYALGILTGLKVHSGFFSFLAFVLAGILGVLIGTEKITYHTAYKLIMSDEVKYILFSDSIITFFIKLIAVICLTFIMVYTYKNTDIGTTVNVSSSYRINWQGDLAHKLSKYPVYMRNYFWMYKSRDFILWKIFSTVVFSIVCYASGSNMVLILVAYGMCLITAFYFKDIYHFERKHIFIYFMSDYPYKKLISDFTVNGIFILGDNILLILLIRCMFNHNSLMVLSGIIISIIMLSLFVNNNLFAKYPMEQYYINICLLLIELHLPILNIFFFCKSIRQGLDNWRDLSYEHK